MQEDNNRDRNRTFGGNPSGWQSTIQKQQQQRQDPQRTIFRKVCAATWQNELAVLKRLVEDERTQKLMSMNPSKITPSVGFGPLHYACSLGNVEIVKYLLDANVCDKNSRDKDGNSPLIWVVRSNFDEATTQDLMEALVDHGCSLNMQNFSGETALFIACDLGMDSKVEMLLENGACSQICNIDGASPMHAAAAGGYVSIIRTLTKQGAHLNAVDYEGDSSLHWAVRAGKVEAVKALMVAGAQVSVRNEDGETPLDLALCFEEKVIVNLFATKRTVPVLLSVPKQEQIDLRLSMDGADEMLNQAEVEMKNLYLEERESKGKSVPVDVFSNVRAMFGSTPPSVSFAI